jgi:hypothetical protein
MSLSDDIILYATPIQTKLLKRSGLDADPPPVDFDDSAAKSTTAFSTDPRCTSRRYSAPTTLKSWLTKMWWGQLTPI